MNFKGDFIFIWSNLHLVPALDAVCYVVQGHVSNACLCLFCAARCWQKVLLTFY